MEPSVFTQILAGELPGEVIWHDDTVAVLLTIQPLTPGHLLVIPVEQVDSLWDLDDATYDHVMRTARRMAGLVAAAYPEYLRVGAIVEGFGVPHAHVHVFGLQANLRATIPPADAGLPVADRADLAVAAQRLRGALGAA